MFCTHKEPDVNFCIDLQTKCLVLPHQLAEIVSPGQEQNLGVVLLPVRQNEAQHDPGHDEVDPEHPHPVLPAPKYGVQGHRQEQGGPAVQSVVKQLPQGRARARPPRLLPVYTIYNHTNTPIQAYTLSCSFIYLPQS